jgi:hypothetical protein
VSDQGDLGDAGDASGASGASTPSGPRVVVPAWLRAEWPITVVLGGVAVGLVVAALAEFRSGTVLMAASVVFAAWLRLMLPHDRAGVLAVRRRPIDVVCLAGLGLALTVLALVVPSP